MVEETKELCSLLCRGTQISSLQGIADLAYEVLGNPVFIEDRAQVKLAYSKNVQIEDPSWRQTIIDEGGQQPLRQAQIKEVESAHMGSIKSHLPVIVEDSHLPIPRLIKTLTVGGVHVGTMISPAYCRPFKEEDIELMEILSYYAIVQLQRRNYNISSNKRSVENFLIRLLNNEKVPSEAMQEYIKILDWNSRPYNYVIVICSRKDQETAPIKDIIHAFQYTNCCRTMIYNNLIVRVYNSENWISDWENEDPGMTDLLKKHNLIAGISRSFPDLSELYDHFQQARCMLDVASTLKNGSLYFAYNENSIYHMFDTASGLYDLKQFCHRKILALEDYDIKHKTDLVPTLHMYLESLRSISKTAEIMKIHRNTVSYRINRCLELLDTRIDEGNEMFSFIFSLRILEYSNKKRGQAAPF